MASCESHIQQWKHNRAFAEIVPPDYPDWCVTAIFYAALHAVDALLSHDRVPGVISHETRKKVLVRTNRYEAIAKKFLPLYDLCRTVRYLANASDWIPFSEIEKDVIVRYLYPIEKSVMKLMEADLKLPKIQLKS